jgi:hypothetical protein
LAVLICGLSFAAMRELCLNMNIKPLSEKEFYGHQARITQPIINYARLICQKNRASMTDNSTIGIDGSWNHRHNGNFCIVDVIDVKTKRIVDFEIIYKSTPFKDGNYIGSSNGMEVAGLSRLLPRWINDSKVTKIVHDKDSKITKLIRESYWNVTQMYDANHAHKSFRRT